MRSALKIVADACALVRAPVSADTDAIWLDGAGAIVPDGAVKDSNKGKANIIKHD